ncbi:FAD/NAD(P)-binding protein [Patescibacteria group bacterium]|nr:FAD/NAD(P)-binding protein [Patescibacteria group bacterium]
MKNNYQTKEAKIVDIKPEAPGIKMYTLQLTKSTERNAFRFDHGQFIEVSLPGYGESPFDVCSTQQIINKKLIQLCIRKAGRVTDKIHQLKKGDLVGIRGPYGHGWPTISELKKKNVLIIGGGIGLIPMRSIIEELAGQPNWQKKMTVFYGAKSTKEFIFKDRYTFWRSQADFRITIDSKERAWSGCTGVITNLFNQCEVNKDTVALVCGPPIMYRFVLEKLKKACLPEKNIYFSLERRMDCGVGICQHCAIGPYYVCKDGPVFRYDKIKEIKGAI